MIQTSAELFIVNTNTTIKNRKRFAIPMVARVFHNDSQPLKSIFIHLSDEDEF
jgi:hypothetical protein